MYAKNCNNKTPETDKPLSARELILTLIDTATTRTVSASYVVSAGVLFGLDSGSIRVALGRLARRGELTQISRGLYGLGSRDGVIQHLIRNWEDAETSTKPWTGHWLTVFCGHLRRSNKTEVRGRERALRLYGFAATELGFWVRPDNLKISTPELRATLRELGLDESAGIGLMADVTPAIHAEQLWDRSGLEARYEAHIQRLRDSAAHLSALSDQQAAKESLLVGRQVSRDILLDPLLPEELINTRLRQALMTEMRSYNRTGRALWRAFLKQHASGLSAE